ncbi:MAG: TIGR04255 family protein [Deltaproteobacteria bacterium]|nr:TIGR04255 family protein [Deltaproteobacteria bacterium]
MNRTLPPLKLEKSPLVLALAQIRFSAVLKMEKFIPDLQEILRHKGFPKFFETQSQEFQQGPQKIELIPTPRWGFADKTLQHVVLIAPNFITLQTNNYDVFEKFVDTLQIIFRAVNEVVAPALVERIGLRYIDLIRPQAEEPLTKYLSEGLHGLHGLNAAKLEVQSLQHRFETIGKTDNGILVIRLSQNKEAKFLPPELDPVGLKFDLDISRNELVTLLDIDHFSITQLDMDEQVVVDTMWNLHDHCDRVFREAVTPYALQKWGSKDIPMS